MSSEVAARPVRPPRLVPCWYLVCPADALPRGSRMRFDLGGEPVVLFRGRDTGIVYALPAHCQHQGVDLSRGDVRGDRLRCPLHHWEYTDRCVTVPGGACPARSAARYVVEERFGMIFLFPGSDPGYPIPSFSVPDERLHFVAGKPVFIECPWYVPVANAFDMTHLETVHRRALRQTPVITYPDPMTFKVDYATAVIGDGWSDRVMRALSGNEIRVNVTCSGGAIIMVESSVRRRRGYLMVSLRPTGNGVSILPFFGTPRRRDGLHRVQARVSGALFTAFLRRDVEALGGIRFPDGFLDNRDETINACYRYLCELPHYAFEETS